jgi:hypothetical protein
MPKQLPPLLITASLDPGRTPQVALSDIGERTLRHMEGLLAWLKEPCVKRVVFAKNCALSIRAEVLAQVAASYGKELEFVQVAPSPRTSIQGKGYGEGDLIRQALDKSEVLRASREFIKVTGKLFMPDAASVFTGEGDGEFFVTPTRSEGSVFPLRHVLRPVYRSLFFCQGLALMRRLRVPWEWIAAAPPGWIDTRCYRTEMGFYQEHLLNSHKRVRDALGYTLENAVFDDLQESEPIRRITTVPVIVGMSGTLGTEAGSFSDDLRYEASDLAKNLLSP